MKYLRVITVVVIAFVFLAALAIGLGVIFAVKNINITIDSYTYSSGSEKAVSEITMYKDNFSDLYKGKLISSVSEDDIAQNLADWNADYTLTSFEKIMPCTINISMVERRETYIYYSEGEGVYNVYDSEGRFYRTAETQDAAMNGGDRDDVENSPNVELILPDESYVVLAASLGSAFHTSFKNELFKNDAPIRSTVEWIQIKDQYVAYNDTHDTKVIFHLRSGIEIEIYDYDLDLDAKMSAAYTVFEGLDAEQKLTGYIHCLYNDSGTMTARYEPKREA